MPKRCTCAGYSLGVGSGVRSPAPHVARVRASSFDQGSSSAPTGSPSPIRSRTLDQLLNPALRDQVRAWSISMLLCLLLVVYFFVRLTVFDYFWYKLTRVLWHWHWAWLILLSKTPGRRKTCLQFCCTYHSETNTSSFGSSTCQNFIDWIFEHSIYECLNFHYHVC